MKLAGVHPFEQQQHSFVHLFLRSFVCLSESIRRPVSLQARDGSSNLQNYPLLLCTGFLWRCSSIELPRKSSWCSNFRASLRYPRRIQFRPFAGYLQFVLMCAHWKHPFRVVRSSFNWTNIFIRRVIDKFKKHFPRVINISNDSPFVEWQFAPCTQFEATRTLTIIMKSEHKP